MKKEDLKKLFSSEKFIEELRRVDSMESLQQFLAEHNLKMSIDEIDKVIDSNAELCENDLEDITGGVQFEWLNFAWKCFTYQMTE